MDHVAMLLMRSIDPLPHSPLSLLIIPIMLISQSVFLPLFFRRCSPRQS